MQTIDENAVLEYGRKLIREMSDEFEAGKSMEDVFDAYLTTNLGKVAVMWAAGVIDDALECDNVYEGIEQAVLEYGWSWKV